MANRAPKSGVALEEMRKLQSKYDPKLASDILNWVSTTTGEQFDTSGDPENFQKLLADGVLLCKLANALEPGSVKKINKSKMVFMQMENISFFLQFAEKYVDKTELFRSVDLAEGTDLYGVLTCLSSVARKSEKLFGKPGLGPKEATAQKREWTAEQLRGGDTIIGLQMGSNKGANAAGINFGNTRHI